MTTQPIKGVNLGGWLVLEKWITPSLFKGTGVEDEYTYCEHAGKEERARLKRFRDEFITKRDFVWLAEQGVQAVRLPVGYWLFGDAAPYQPTVQYVDKAFEWAAATGIKVLLDLHGAPGSQNGRDHSGQQGRTHWHQQPHAAADTLAVIRRLVERYGRHAALLGISLLNEPSPIIPKAQLLRYYERAHHIIREACGDDTWIVFGDGYLPLRWRNELPLDRFPSTYHDTHYYRVFGPLDKLLPPQAALLRTRWLLPRATRWMTRRHPVIVGEWSLALGSRLLRRPHPTAADRAHRRSISRTYAQAQLQAFGKGGAAAWFFWTYRTENRIEWSFRDCVQQKLLPKSRL